MYKTAFAVFAASSMIACAPSEAQVLQFPYPYNMVCDHKDTQFGRLQILRQNGPVFRTDLTFVALCRDSQCEPIALERSNRPFAAGFDDHGDLHILTTSNETLVFRAEGASRFAVIVDILAETEREIVAGSVPALDRAAEQPNWLRPTYCAPAE
jgi:hypothetical protein